MKTKPSAEQIDALLEDWFEREEGTFVKVGAKDRMGWEATIDEDASYSSYIVDAPTTEELIKRSHPLAYDTLLSMNIPRKDMKVQITSDLNTHCDKDAAVKVSTKVFDDERLTNGDKLDVFLGLTIHEGCHILHTDFSKFSHHPVIQTIQNILEDERIETKLCETRGGFSNFLEATKYYYFDLLNEKVKSGTPFDRIMNTFMKVIRYPKTLSEADIVEFYPYLVRIKDIFNKYEMDSTKATLEMASEIYEVIKDFYKDEEKKDEDKKPESDSDESGAGGDGNSSEQQEQQQNEKEDKEDEKSEGNGETEKNEQKEDKGGKPKETPEDSESGDVENETPTDESKTENPISDKDIEDKILSDSKELRENIVSAEHKLDTYNDVSATINKNTHLFGLLEDGQAFDGDKVFFSRKKDDQAIYKLSYERVRKYVPMISKHLTTHCREYQLTSKSMRSGVLDTSRLAEAYQGVETVYLRHQKVSTKGVCVCILIDESGSMRYGGREESARDAAVLINEAVKGTSNVELFIYGHTADTRGSGSTEISVYREKDYAPKFALGSSKATYENRDGTAILAVAKRVRSMTKNNVLMFVISDGEPCAESYYGYKAKAHTKEAIKKVEKMGFGVVGICINTYNAKEIYEHVVELFDMSTLAVELGKVVRRATLKAAKVCID